MGGKARVKRRYFIAERREVYLDCLRVTGSHRAAAREAGVSAQAVRRYRARDAGYAARCEEAAIEAQRRLAVAESPFDGAAAFESIRRGADGRLKIQALGRRRWSKQKEDRFFDVLRECGNIAASARAAGVTRRTVWKRRRDWPAFARRFEETMEEAEIVLEFRVACLGTNWSERAGGDEEAPPPGYAWSPSPANAGEDVAIPFDPELAIRFLKWRAEQKGGRRRTVAALPPAGEVRERIVRKVMAIKRHKALMAKRRAEEGNSSPMSRSPCPRHGCECPGDIRTCSFGGEGDQA